MPTIEIISSVKYLHMSSGSKYKILSSNKLDGYVLNDITFGAATDFTVNGLTSSYALTDLNGTKEYFYSDGRYLGTKDKMGNKTQVYYNADGTVNKIYDTAGRYLSFGYTTVANTSRTVTVTLYDSDASSSKLSTPEFF